MSIFERYEQFADKTFGDASDKYLADFTGKCRKRQWYAIQHVLPYIKDNSSHRRGRQRLRGIQAQSNQVRNGWHDQQGDFNRHSDYESGSKGVALGYHQPR